MRDFWSEKIVIRQKNKINKKRNKKYRYNALRKLIFINMERKSLEKDAKAASLIKNDRDQ